MTRSPSVVQRMMGPDESENKIITQPLLGLAKSQCYQYAPIAALQVARFVDTNQEEADQFIKQQGPSIGGGATPMLTLFAKKKGVSVKPISFSVKSSADGKRLYDLVAEGHAVAIGVSWSDQRKKLSGTLTGQSPKFTFSMKNGQTKLLLEKPPGESKYAYRVADNWKLVHLVNDIEYTYKTLNNLQDKSIVLTVDGPAGNHWIYAIPGSAKLDRKIMARDQQTSRDIEIDTNDRTGSDSSGRTYQVTYVSAASRVDPK